MSSNPNLRAPSLAEVEAVFAALAHDVRRQIVLLLAQRGGELPSGYLAARFEHSWPTTTRHLGVLEKAGILDVRRDGRSSHYRLNREHVQHVLGGWLRLLPTKGPEQTWKSSGPRTTAELKQSHLKGSRR